MVILLRVRRCFGPLRPMARYLASRAVCSWGVPEGMKANAIGAPQELFEVT